MKRVIAVVAVIGLTLTAVMGCATRNESVEALASEAEASEAASLKKDCAYIYYETSTSLVDYLGETDEEIYQLFTATFAHIWTQLNDPDLKSIFRSLADGFGDGNFAALNGESDWIAYATICGS